MSSPDCPAFPASLLPPCPLGRYPEARGADCLSARLSAGPPSSPGASMRPSTPEGVRLHVLRRDHYRCTHREDPHAPACGSPASAVTSTNPQAVCAAHKP